MAFSWYTPRWGLTSEGARSLACYWTNYKIERNHTKHALFLREIYSYVQCGCFGGGARYRNVGVNVIRCRFTGMCVLVQNGMGVCVRMVYNQFCEWGLGAVRRVVGFYWYFMYMFSHITTCWLVYMLKAVRTECSTAANAVETMATVLIAEAVVVAAFADDCKVNGRKSAPFELIRASTELEEIDKLL